MALIDPDHTVYFSSASLWEIAIKTSLGKPGFQVDADTTLELALKTGFVEVPLVRGWRLASSRSPGCIAIHSTASWSVRRLPYPQIAHGGRCSERIFAARGAYRLIVESPFC